MPGRKEFLCSHVPVTANDAQGRPSPTVRPRGIKAEGRRGLGVAKDARFLRNIFQSYTA